MPSPMFNVIQPTVAIRYTGLNSADIDAQVPNVTVISEEDGVLTLDNNGISTMTVSAGEWVMSSGSGNFVLPDSLFVKEWACVAVCTELEAVVQRVEALENP